MASGRGSSGADFGVGSRKAALPFVPVDDGKFNYNQSIPVEVSQKRYRDYWIRPIGGVVNQQGPFTFSLEPSMDQYMQLNRAGVEIVARVVGPDGGVLNAWEDLVAPVNLLGACMWESVEVFLNGHPFPGPSAINVGYKAYMETMLSYDSAAADTHLQTQFFYLDTPGQYGNFRVSSDCMRLAYMRAILSGQEARPEIPEELRADPALQPPDEREDAHILKLNQTEWNEILNESDDEDDGEEVDEIEVTDDDVMDYEEATGGSGKNVQASGDLAPWDLNLDGRLDKSKEGWKRRVLDERRKRKRRWALYYDTWKKSLSALQKIMSSKRRINVNHGYDTRFTTVSASHPFDMYSPIAHDLFRLDNHVAPGNKLDIRLTMYPHSFLLNSFIPETRYRLEILDMKLHLHTIERKERIAPPMSELYNMNQTQVHRQLVAKGLPSTTFRIHNGGVMPKTIIVAMVYAQAAEGRYNYNPFNFHHFHINRLAFNINGETYPSDGLRFNFRGENIMCARGYSWVYDNTGAYKGTSGNLITRNAFQAGAFIVSTDLCPDKCNLRHNHGADYGYIDLDLSFDVELPEPIYVIYEFVYNKVVVNDKVENEVAVLDVEAGE